MPRPADGQVLARTHFLSIDPYMRRQMGGGHGQYANPLKPGDVMIGRGAGVVIESRHPDFKAGDAVQSEFGWREHAVLDGRGLRKLPADLKPLSLSLGLIGQSGATAMVGLVRYRRYQGRRDRRRIGGGGRRRQRRRPDRAHQGVPRHRHRRRA